MIEKAKAFATNAHMGQTRKNSNDAYITHPIRVAQRLKDCNFSDELVCAAYLHDVVEDTPFNIDDIDREFGPAVATLVAAHTEDKTKSWKERKQLTIDTIKSADKEIKYLIVADKLDNLLGLEKDLLEQGDTIWRKFNAGPDKQKWYNESIAKNMYTGLKDDEIPGYFKEFEEAVKRVFGGMG
ncbi:HD domain-containing protein [Oceanobacillus bengalensis]|uniref:Bifunctional (P)ppGpp synthetase/guanosine-3',5'-bis(Diphosphate) 3'-pyrophosphohydrolase n=1 Tax=Oceanobacillus bengalensis TaxID=1435466 RepID=A0A494Z300_9BACI|nr:HD domain-containing protein [Oceanobacillus bengalensis]RKQ16871.1 bifunctional (p)ppGpp synthetase/guanosine-3',5'-bis(diphosphate) 3'-pyrophosphohydrolase [Oceanobacillus bengalensis]